MSTAPTPAQAVDPVGSGGPFARRAADALAYECAKAVRSGRLDARSGIADALLDYLDVGGVSGPLDVCQWMLDYERRLQSTERAPKDPFEAFYERPDPSPEL